MIPLSTKNPPTRLQSIITTPYSAAYSSSQSRIHHVRPVLLHRGDTFKAESGLGWPCIEGCGQHIRRAQNLRAVMSWGWEKLSGLVPGPFIEFHIRDCLNQSHFHSTTAVELRVRKSSAKQPLNLSSGECKCRTLYGVDRLKRPVEMSIRSEEEERKGINWIPGRRGSGRLHCRYIRHHQLGFHMPLR